MSIPEPTRSYRPEVSVDTVTRLTLDLYGLHVTSCRELDSYDDRNFLVQVDPSRVDNVHLGPVWPHGYVLKILNSLDSQKPEVTEAKNAMMMAAANKGFPSARPLPSVSCQLICLQPLKAELTESEDSDKTETYLIRLVEFLPGDVLASVTLTPQLSFQVGQQAARLDLALKDVDDADLPPLLVAWNMQHVPSLRRLLTFVPHPHQAAVLSDVITAFDRHVLQRQSGLQTGLIHSDFNDHNILVSPEENSPSSSSPVMKICGVLDFGDATKSFLLIEAAIAMAYLMLMSPSTDDPDVISGHVLAGYLSELQLSKQELELIPLTICARFSHTLIFGYHRQVLEPENVYCMVHAKQAWPHLERLWSRPVVDTLDIWRKVAEDRGVTFYPAADPVS